MRRAGLAVLSLVGCSDPAAVPPATAVAECTEMDAAPPPIEDDTGTSGRLPRTIWSFSPPGDPSCRTTRVRDWTTSLRLGASAGVRELEVSALETTTMTRSGSACQLESELAFEGGGLPAGQRVRVALCEAQALHEDWATLAAISLEVTVAAGVGATAGWRQVSTRRVQWTGGGPIDACEPGLIVEEWWQRLRLAFTMDLGDWAAMHSRGVPTFYLILRFDEEPSVSP